MTEILSEQMRSLSRRLAELDSSGMKDSMPTAELKGSINTAQLADLLGIQDLPLFSRSINKVRRGDTDKLHRAEMTELAVAFVNLLAADADATQKALAAIKRVTAQAPDKEI